MDTPSTVSMYAFVAHRLNEHPEGVVEKCGVIAASLEAATAMIVEKFGGDDWVVRHYDHGTEKQVTGDTAPRFIYEDRAPERDPTVSANDLYAMKPLNERNPVWRLLTGNHFTEFDAYLVDEQAVTKDGRLEVRVIADPYIDPEYTCTLSTVWFDGKPVMVVQNAGKRNDHTCEYITDEDLYYKLVAYLRTFLPKDERRAVTDPTAKLRELTAFGGFADILLTRE